MWEVGNFEKHLFIKGDFQGGRYRGTRGGRVKRQEFSNSRAVTPSPLS